MSSKVETKAPLPISGLGMARWQILTLTNNNNKKRRTVCVCVGGCLFLFFWSSDLVCLMFSPKDKLILKMYSCGVLCGVATEVNQTVLTIQESRVSLRSADF